MDRPFYEIHQFKGDINNPLDLAYFVKAGVREFIPEVSTVYDLNRTDTIIIDLDPKDPAQFSFEDTRGATQVVAAALLTEGCALRQTYKVVAHKFRFSGNRSFHLYIRLDGPKRFEEVREAVKQSLDVAVKLYPSQLSYKNLRAPDGSGRKDYMLVDIGALSRHRCVRSLWSIHHKSQMVCVPVENLATFSRDCASMEAVVERGMVEEVFV